MISVLMAEGYDIEASTSLEYILDSITDITKGLVDCDHCDTEQLSVYYLHLYKGTVDVEDKYVNVIKTHLDDKSKHVSGVIVNNRLNRRRCDLYHATLVAEYNLRLRETGSLIRG